MDKLIIRGNADLKGEISIKGSKNSALPIIVSALLSEHNLILQNIPKLDDIKNIFPCKIRLMIKDLNINKS